MTDQPQPGPSYIACAYWGEEIVPSVERECVECHAALAMDARNVQTVISEKAQPICIPCAAKVVADPEGWEYGGDITRGIVTGPDKAMFTKSEIEERLTKLRRI